MVKAPGANGPSARSSRSPERDVEPRGIGGVTVADPYTRTEICRRSANASASADAADPLLAVDRDHHGPSVAADAVRTDRRRVRLGSAPRGSRAEARPCRGKRDALLGMVSSGTIRRRRSSRSASAANASFARRRPVGTTAPSRARTSASPARIAPPRRLCRFPPVLPEDQRRWVRRRSAQMEAPDGAADPGAAIRRPRVTLRSQRGRDPGPRGAPAWRAASPSRFTRRAGDDPSRSAATRKLARCRRTRARPGDRTHRDQGRREPASRSAVRGNGCVATRRSARSTHRSQRRYSVQAASQLRQERTSGRPSRPGSRLRLRAADRFHRPTRSRPPIAAPGDDAGRRESPRECAVRPRPSARAIMSVRMRPQQRRHGARPSEAVLAILEQSAPHRFDRHSRTAA